MAARTRKTAAPAEVEEVEVEETTAEPTFKQTANAAIDDATAQLGVEAKDRYKVQRAFGFIAMQLALEEGSLDELISAVVEGAGDLPSGFGLERSVADEKPAPKAKAAAKPAAKKAPEKAAAKPAARKRPAR